MVKLKCERTFHIYELVFYKKGSKIISVFMQNTVPELTYVEANNTTAHANIAPFMGLKVALHIGIKPNTDSS